MESSEYLSPTEAGGLFPRPLGAVSVRHRITRGIEGVKLAATFDGRRYWVRPESVDAFLKEVAEARKTRTQYLSEYQRDVEERCRAIWEKRFGNKPRQRVGT